ncbi:FFLEELY motif protein [Litoribrevibacter albus]|uniref:DUF8198 domain-containing protein n=1 Tax=Litoribrevibacter albus TaxID=1473156 RepID=A0AA37SF73_9GAMM|nr:hypothetical protein [Litoribrevibacter albus]GLQ33482.1 hypothetical protein GCM10007876_39620 [Litoribrevibacter albus]
MIKDKLAKPVSGKHGENLRQLLIQNRSRHNQEPPKHQQLALQHLMVWQTDRLRNTHQDLFLSDRYQAAAHYFVDELYLSPTAIQRDRDLERVFPTLVKLLPDDTLETVANAIELNILSAELDQQLANFLFIDHPEKAICASLITEESYVTAYLKANATELRHRQLNLIEQIGHDLDHLVRFPFISLTLKLIRKPAHKKGLGNLHDFLERGFNTFKALGGAEEFMEIIVQREGQVLDNLNQGKSNPFDIKID